MKIPGMDGIEILKRMKEIDADIRVIIMTAYGELDMIQEAKDLGAFTHFAKPFDIDDIREAVREYLPFNRIKRILVRISCNKIVMNIRLKHVAVFI